MKPSFLILLSIFLLCSCGRRYNEPLNNKIAKYIQTNCEHYNPCKIQLKDSTDFSWDKLVVFDISAEQDEISRITGKEFSPSSPYYSRKWFFLKDDQIVRAEEQILYEIDVPMKNGDVDFEITGTENNFAVYSADAIFNLEKNNTGTVEYYRLHCSNCK